MPIEGSNRRLSLHGTSLAEGNANFPVVIVFRYADDLMAGFEHREEAERLQGINQHASAPSKYASRRRVGVYAMNPETRPLFLRCTADGKRFTDDHKVRGRRGRVRVTSVVNGAAGLKNQARRHSERPTCNSPPGHFPVKLRRSRRHRTSPSGVPAGERTKKAPSRGGRTGSNGQQHPVVIDCEVLRKRRSRCPTPGELRATRRMAWI